jgi:hypothetical protein
MGPFLRRPLRLRDGLHHPVNGTCRLRCAQALKGPGGFAASACDPTPPAPLPQQPRRARGFSCPPARCPLMPHERGQPRVAPLFSSLIPRGCAPSGTHGRMPASRPDGRKRGTDETQRPRPRRVMNQRPISPRHAEANAPATTDNSSRTPMTNTTSGQTKIRFAPASPRPNNHANAASQIASSMIRAARGAGFMTSEHSALG